MLQEVGFGASLYKQGLCECVTTDFMLITKVCLYERLFFYVLLVYKITNENVILIFFTWFDVDRYRCVRARCSWSQVSAFQHYHNLPLSFSLSQSLYSSPQALSPRLVLIRRPFLLLPYAPDSLPPSPSSLPPPSPSSRPGPSGPFQWHSLSTTPSTLVPCPPPTLVPSFTVSPRAHSVRHLSSRPV